MQCAWNLMWMSGKNFQYMCIKVQSDFSNSRDCFVRNYASLKPFLKILEISWSFLMLEIDRLNIWTKCFFKEWSIILVVSTFLVPLEDLFYRFNQNRLVAYCSSLGIHEDTIRFTLVSRKMGKNSLWPVWCIGIIRLGNLSPYFKYLRMLNPFQCKLYFKC